MKLSESRFYKGSHSQLHEYYLNSQYDTLGELAIIDWKTNHRKILASSQVIHHYMKNCKGCNNYY